MTITADDVRRWMEEAGGEVQWEAACAAVAEALNGWVEGRALVEKVEADNKHVARDFRRAHDAVNELRAALPTVVDRYASQIREKNGWERRNPEWFAECKRMHTLCGELLLALTDIPKRPTTSPFHDRGRLFAFLFIAAGQITGKSPTTYADGFAVQFVQRAHAAVEGNKARMTPGAVAKALQRSEDARAALAAAVSDALRRDRAP